MSPLFRDKHPESELNEEELFMLLASSRRRQLVLILDDSDESDLTVRDLADKLAEEECTGRQACYVSLIQQHLPKFDKAGVINYDDDEKTLEILDTGGLAWMISNGKEIT